MARTIACPKCHQPFPIADEDLGKKVTCPNCNASLQTRAPSAPAPVMAVPPRATTPAPRPMLDDEDDYRDVTRGTGGGNWGATVSGLKLVWWASLLILIFSLLVEVLTLSFGSSFAAGRPKPEDVQILGLASSGAGCVMLIGVLLGFVGMCLCCTAPDPTASRRALASIVCTVGSILVFMVLMAMLFKVIFQLIQQGQAGAAPPDPEELVRTIGIPGIIGLALFVVLLLAGGLLWQLFHLAVARHFHNDKLASQIRSLIAVWILFAVAGQALNYWVRSEGGPLNTLGGLPFYLTHGFAIVNLLCTVGWYTHVCQQTYRTIQAATGRANDEMEDRG